MFSRDEPSLLFRSGLSGANRRSFCAVNEPTRHEQDEKAGPLSTHNTAINVYKDQAAFLSLNIQPAQKHIQHPAYTTTTNINLPFQDAPSTLSNRNDALQGTPASTYIALVVPLANK